MVEGGPHTPLPFNSSTIVSGMTDESLVNAGLEFIFEQGGGGGLAHGMIGIGN